MDMAATAKAVLDDSDILNGASADDLEMVEEFSAEYERARRYIEKKDG